jgi:hypothetical protein
MNTDAALTGDLIHQISVRTKPWDSPNSLSSTS